jgi:serine O-acetyltransferase
MNESFKEQLFHKHTECVKCPSLLSIKTFFNELMGLMFPSFSSKPIKSREQFDLQWKQLEVDFDAMLFKNLINRPLDEVRTNFFQAIPGIYEKLCQDVQAMHEGDPASRSKEEVIRAYPGFVAISAYRVAHELLHLGVLNIPRMITEYAHSKTGIDIHPGANIGNHFCIDHGTGVVIGETAVIGEHVKIYQGVTLGALSVKKEDASVKRHPTIENHVVLYAGATILGGDTIIGEHSVIGGNVWLTRSVPPHSKIYYQAKMSDVRQGTSDEIIIK